ncbi:MAG: hypothetical protein JW733_03150 [Coriobacteriia bacterium]|nr:hypothetical protein [Coriobacteriia bacterium]MBN2839383.1 hypothetical protein [Coriobacteriia bacterium]
MRSKVVAVVVGVALVALGVILSGNALGWWSADLFFDGWWTLFLIVPGLVSLLGQGPNLANIILIGVGALLLADAQQAFGDISVWSLIMPLILVAVGATVVWKGVATPKLPVDSEGRPLPAGSQVSAVFSGSTAAYNGLPFTGATTLAVFGGVDLDLRGAIIENDVVIDATSLFGGTDIIVSPGTKVELTSVGVFGGSDSNAEPPQPGATGPVVHVRSTAVFGGLEVKVK